MNSTLKAIEYAEKYGIISFKVKGRRMVYYVNYPATQFEKRRTYKVIVDLKKMREHSRVLLKQCYRPGNHNMYK